MDMDLDTLEIMRRKWQVNGLEGVMFKKGLQL